MPNKKGIKIIDARFKPAYFLFIVTILVFFLAGCSVNDTSKESDAQKNPAVKAGRATGEKASSSANNQSSVGRPIGMAKEVSTNENLSVTAPKAPQPEIPSGSIAIFYTVILSDVASRLPVSVQYAGNEGGGYVTNIRWETTDLGVVRYIPAMDRFDVMGATKSYSYSKSSIFPITLYGRSFYFIERGTSSTITEIDPKSAKVKSSAPAAGARFAIAGDKFYFHEKVRTDLFDKRTGGGELMAQNLNGGAPVQLLAYGDSDNQGVMYGAGNALFSLSYDPGTKASTIRRHDLQTGKVTGVLHTNIPPGGQFFSGGDGLYHVTASGKIYTVSLYPLQGEVKGVLQVELDADEYGLSVDEEDRKLLLVSYGKDFKVKNILLHDLATDVTSEIPFKSPFGSNSVLDYQFIILK